MVRFISLAVFLVFSLFSFSFSLSEGDILFSPGNETYKTGICFLYKDGELKTPSPNDWQKVVSYDQVGIDSFIVKTNSIMLGDLEYLCRDLYKNYSEFGFIDLDDTTTFFNGIYYNRNIGRVYFFNSKKGYISFLHHDEQGVKISNYNTTYHDSGACHYKPHYYCEKHDSLKYLVCNRIAPTLPPESNICEIIDSIGQMVGTGTQWECLMKEFDGTSSIKKGSLKPNSSLPLFFADGKLFLSSEEEKVNLAIYNVSGRKIFSIRENFSAKSIELCPMPAGSYICVFKTHLGCQIKKLVKY